MDKLTGDGISVKLMAISDGEVVLEVSVTRKGEAMVYWRRDNIRQGDSFGISGLSVKVPITINEE